MESCEYYKEQISAYIDGELDAQSESALIEHIKVCSECGSLLEFYQSLSQGISTLEQEPPEGFARGVMSRVHDSKKKQRGVFAFRYGTAAAAVLAVIILGVSTFYQKNNDTPASMESGASGGGSIVMQEPRDAAIEAPQQTASNSMAEVAGSIEDSVQTEESEITEESALPQLALFSEDGAEDTAADQTSDEQAVILSVFGGVPVQLNSYEPFYADENETRFSVAPSLADTLYEEFETEGIKVYLASEEPEIVSNSIRISIADDVEIQDSGTNVQGETSSETFEPLDENATIIIFIVP